MNNGQNIRTLNKPTKPKNKQIGNQLKHRTVNKLTI